MGLNQLNMYMETIMRCYIATGNASVETGKSYLWKLILLGQVIHILTFDAPWVHTLRSNQSILLQLCQTNFLLYFLLLSRWTLLYSLPSKCRNNAMSGFGMLDNIVT